MILLKYYSIGEFAKAIGKTTKILRSCWKVILGNKARLYPTLKQEQNLWQSVGTARFIYNWTLAKQEENHKNGGKFISDNDLRKEITILKQDSLNWLNEVSNNVPKQAVKDGCEAYKKFFKGLADKPRFKSRRKFSSN